MSSHREVVVGGDPGPANSADDPLLSGVRRQRALLQERVVSSRELVERSLALIEAAQPSLNAFRCVRAQEALEEADEADRALGRGERRPLLGVPVAIKDDIDLAGETTGFGCEGTFEPKAADAEAVRRLRSAGSPIVGKTTTPELGQWPVTESRVSGITRNPWSLEHTPGGSSGGSAAAVAGGLIAAALGSDGLGSVRVPAAWTHLVGIKPQRGRISTWPDPEPFNGLACIGPLARQVADAALLLDAATGNHPHDPHRPPPPDESFLDVALRADPGRPLRIALSCKPPFAVFPTPVDDRACGLVKRMGEVLEGLGHHVEQEAPRFGVLGVGVLPRSMAGISEWCRRVPDTSLLDRRTLETARLGGILGGPVLKLARALERPMARQVGKIFDRYDLVLMPTTAQPPLAIGALSGLSSVATDRRMLAACPFTWPWNVLGWPAMSVPAGLTDGLPLGAQLLGPSCSESLLISLAAQLEASERWHERWPPNRVQLAT